MRLKKGDMVIILSGKNKGKKGKILEVIPKEEKIVVEGVNIVKKHQRPTNKFPGGIIEKPLAIFASKAMLVCPQCSEPNRPKMVNRVRVCRKCGEMIDRK